MVKADRIEYIDLMKGICISLVVIVHCGVTFPYDIINDLLQNLRMPLYFCLSGLFFKEYGSFLEFLIKKTNKLIIPYIFFCYIPYALFDLVYSPNANRTIVYYIFMGIEPYNFPLWFLRSLFMAYVMFYALNKFSKGYNKLYILLLLLVLSFFVWLSSYHIPKAGWHFLLENVLTSFFALPFLFVASFLRKQGFLTFNFKGSQLLSIFIIGLGVWIVFVQKNVYFITAHYGDVYPFLYFSACGGIACIWVLCYLVKKLFFFSYLGRYSIVVLGTFAPINHLLSFWGINGIYQALITLALMPLMIFICVNIFPHFTAQKDLINYKSIK